MAIDMVEVEAVADALADTVGELLNQHQTTLIDLMNGSDRAKLQAIFDGVREAFREVKSHEERRAWDEDVRAFTVALLGTSMANKVESSADAGIVVTTAVNMANRVQELRKRSRDPQ